MRSRVMLLAQLFVIGSIVVVAPPRANAAQGDAVYEFVAPPGENWNLVYRVNRSTGEVGACEFQPGKDTVGTTLCFATGDGAGPQAAGDYTLVATHLAKEGGVFRVNRQTGDMSICYTSNSKVICTAPAH